MDDNVKKVSFTNGDLPNCVHVTDPSIELDMFPTGKRIRHFSWKAVPCRRPP